MTKPKIISNEYKNKKRYCTQIIVIYFEEVVKNES